LKFSDPVSLPAPPAQPVDDLLYKPTDLEGVLTVKIPAARQLREPATWFSERITKMDDDKSTTSNSSAPADPAAAGVENANRSDTDMKSEIKTRRLIKYDAKAAMEWHERNKKEALEALKSGTKSFSRSNALGMIPETEEGEDKTKVSTKKASAKPTDDIRTSMEADLARQVPGSPSSQNGIDDARTVHSVDINSVSRKELTLRAGVEAGQKLRRDPSLQKAETNRTVLLGALKSSTHKAASQERAAKIDAESALRKKVKLGKEVKKRDIMKDPAAMALLNIPHPTIADDVKQGDVIGKEALPVRKPISSNVNATTEKPTDMTTTDRSAPANATQASAIPSDAKMIKSPDDQMTRAVWGPDLWEVIVDAVITISDSRLRRRDKTENEDKSADLSLFWRLAGQGHRVSGDAFAMFDPPKSPLATPTPSSKAKPTKIVKGSIPTPKNLRKSASGYASVSTTMSVLKHRSNVSDAKQKLQDVAEDQNNAYDEIYRRLILVPAMTYAELNGDKKASNSQQHHFNYALRFFRRADKNKNNLISFPEFVTFLKEHNIDITMEDSKSLFERFQTNKRDGNIDWEEFVNFFNNITTSSRDQMIPDKRPLQMIISLLKKTLVEVLKEMKERSVASLDMLISYRTASVQGVMVPKTPKITRPSLSHKLSEPSVSMNKSGYNDLISNDDDEDDIDNNAIFHQLEANDASTNATRLRKLGLDITDDEMLRISRVFGYNVNYLMSFIRKPIIKCNGEPGRANMTQVTVNDAVNETISMLTTIFEQKSGVSERDLTTHENILKVWYGIAPTIGTTVSYDDVASYFYNTLTDNLVAKKEKNSLVNSMDVEIPSQNSSGLIRAALSSPDKTTGSVRNGSYDNLKPAIKIFNIDARILSRIMVDNMVYSIWNRSNTNNVPQAGFIPNDRTLISTLSLSGFEAYIRETFIDKLERKLRYLMEIEKNSSSPSVYLLVHVFLKSSLDEFIILAHDPITGEIYKINSKEDLRDLPINEKLYRLFPYRDRIEEFSNQLPTDVRMKCYNPYAYHYYNPWDTPYEDAAISGVITRLRLIRGENTKSKLIISEEEKFVQQIKTILDNSVELPFFCSVNETVLRFDVEAAVITDQSICRYIFGNIRKQKPLYSFLVRVMSSLNVVLSSYNSGVLVVMTWGSMLAYLTGYRNPFVTIQLLPRFLEPEHYHYYLKDDNSVFTGDNEENDPYTVHKADVCVDGGTHPVWNTEFKINFQPPKLTSCKVLSTGITKMKIESSFKYVVVLVREGILPSTSPTNPAIIFKFLTAYDPRAATEYQCGVHDDCKLSDLLKRRDVVTKKDDATAEADQINELEELVQALENAADTNKLILGPAITPRLLLSVYNKRGNGEELIGSAQMSISSVLSGSGVGKAQWVTLTYSFDSGNGKMVDSKAGEVQVELSFRKKAEIIAEIQAETDRVKRLQQQYESRKTTSRKFQLDSLDEVNHMKSIQSTARQTTMEAMVVSLSESTDDQKTQDSIVQEKFQPSNNSSNERNKLTPEIELKLKNAINEGKKLLQEKNEIDSHNKTLLAKLQEQDDIIQKLHHEKHALINTTETPDKNNDDPKNDQYSTYSHEEISKRDELIQTKELQLQRLQKEHDLLRQESEELRQQFNRNINDLTTQSIKSNDFHDSSINIFTIEKSLDITTELLRHFLLRQQKITGGKMTSAGGGPLEPLNRMLKTYGRSSDDKISKTDFKDALNHLMIQMSMEQIQLLYDEVHCEPMTVTALITYLKQQMNSFMIQKNSSRKVATDTNNSNTTTIPFTGTSSSGGGIMSDTVSDNSKKKKKVKPSTMKNIDENIKDFSVDERPTVSAIKAQTSEIYLPQIASAKVCLFNVL
jgi:Ca2+-binding EF-hand superfamily protein